MKAILVIDEMPNHCMECPLFREEFTLCPNIEKPLNEKRPAMCPLKPMPEEFTVESLSEEKQGITKLVLNLATMKVFADGYNACLEEINK